MSEVVITSKNFEQEVLKSDVPVVIDFWATWCGPCRMLGPILAQVAEEYEGRIKVGKVNVDEEGELAQQYGIMSIPALHFYKNGKFQFESIGLVPKETLEDLVSKVL